MYCSHNFYKNTIILSQLGLSLKNKNFYTSFQTYKLIHLESFERKFNLE